MGLHLKLSNGIGRRLMGNWSQLAQSYRASAPRIVPAKLPLMEQAQKAQKIRCGVVLKSLSSERDAAFLSALLADVYATDQYWYREFCSRYKNSAGPRLIKYAPSLDVQKEGLTTVYSLPSPWLQKHAVELSESDVPATATDDCHLYLSTSPELTHLTRPWPSLQITDSNLDTPLGSRELNSFKALTGINKFVENKQNVNEYLESLESSNFLNVTRKFEEQLDDKSRILHTLGQVIVENIYKTDKITADLQEFESQRASFDCVIDDWFTQAHADLLSHFKPRLDKFVHDQLSVFRVYTYSESKIELKLRELCDLSDTAGVMERINHLRGKLNLPLLVSFPRANSDSLYNRVPILHRNINDLIYRQFFMLQLPLTTCAICGSLSGQLSNYSMGSLAMLGIVLGTSRIMNRWSSMLRRFEDEILEEKRLEIENGKISIKREWLTETAERESLLRDKIKLLESLEKQ
ncbi:LANO_0D04522g1_1 [Lachancea nothofagi CBS 11611]|uniref:LANO_0D04522g1_1 n=1 Tax=Lachancea nothofagi CBS 11611 TaxID=1266666 RepID=A0A1G4JGT2_9SACH|nr:LANO_0D04522g1_1 [Lachancea nothofagi CBS 11611]